MLKKQRVTKEEALNFILTYIVVEQGRSLNLDQLSLFNLSNLAQQATETINETEGIIPHEVIEELATSYLESLT